MAAQPVFPGSRGLRGAAFARSGLMKALAGALAAASLLAAAPVLAQQPANALPPGEGRELVIAACTQCHGTGVFTQLRVGPEGWRFQVYDMILRGAQLGPADIDPAVNYLAANFGPGINLPPPLFAATLPAGEGRELVEQRCSACHGMDRLVAASRSPREWDAIVARMSFLGALSSREEAARIASYLKSRLAAAP